MNFLLIFIIIESFCAKKSLGRDFESSALQKVIFNLTQSLSQRKHLVSVIASSSPTDKTNSAKLSGGIPHINLKKTFDSKTQTYRLNSSAIVILDEVKSIRTFNEVTTLPFTFSLAQQLFIYCRDGTFDKIVTVGKWRQGKPILLYEYFAIEDDNSIRLLTFEAYTPEKCFKLQLVEVNTYFKSSRLWKHKNFWVEKFSNFYGCNQNFVFFAGMPEFVPTEIDYEKKKR